VSSLSSNIVTSDSLASTPSTAAAPVEHSLKRPLLAPSSAPQMPQYPMYAHPDVNRTGCEPLAKRRARPYQAQHEAEISRRFRVALAMDHQLVQAPDWRTPFADQRDVVQRLLPFHVFQYPDSAIESGVKMEEERAVRSAASLAPRLQAIALRYNAILASEGSDRCYDTQHMLLDRQRAAQAKSEVAGLKTAAMMPMPPTSYFDNR
ncbi:hypothetical protein IWW38_005015, partial [Coemansia aciculifera]